MDQLTASVDVLHEFSLSILRKAGLNEFEAGIVSESLIFADLRGVDTHGLIRLGSYLERIHAGVMELNPAMTLIRDYPASAVLDAGNGFGQIAGVKAMELAIEKARTCGIGAVGVKNSNHFGVAAFFAMRALSAKMIGLALTNASPGIAPYGASKALLGTNPIAVAVPAAKHQPVVLDMASSTVSRGKIRLALLAGESIPLDWALDERGKPTADPKAALKGTMAAVGGPKGSGLSLIIDLLCGVLNGAGLTGDVCNLTDTSAPCRTGHLMIAIDPSKFTDAESFLRDVDTSIQRIKDLPSANGGPIYLPGELEGIRADDRRANGIPLSRDVRASLEQVAKQYGVPEPWSSGPDIHEEKSISMARGNNK